MAYYCGFGGRLRVAVSAVQQPVAGIKSWRRTESTQTQDVVDFESATNNAGLPIAGVCPGPAVITYEVEGYFVSTPATGVNFTSDMFTVGTNLTADFLFAKTGTVGIKLVACMVTNVTMGQEVNGVASFSASMRQIGDDPSPLVS